MTGREGHPRDGIQDLLDGRLDPAGRAEIEAHLASCERCRAEERVLRAVQQAARSRLLPLALPAGFEDGLSAALDGEDGRTARPYPTTSHRPVRRAVLVAAAIVLLGVIGIWISRDTRGPGDLATLLGNDFDRVTSGALALSLPVTDPTELELRFATEGIPFPTHVYDLGMMRFTLSGGRVHTVAGRPSALFVYRAPDGAWLICQMYPGSVEELPTGSEVRTHNGIRFHTFRRENVTVVFWQEGGIVCALASDLPSAQVVELALAKAMRV